MSAERAMSSCWKILGIAPTDDVEAIKGTYRNLVKKYHPDRVRSPERVRHYTIKCAEINEAYRQALQERYAGKTTTQVEFDQPASTSPGSAAPAAVPFSSSRMGSIVAIAIVVVGALCWAEVLFDLKVGPLSAGIALFQWFGSLPVGSLARAVLSGLFVVPIGVVLGGFAATFSGPILLPMFVIGWFEDTNLSRYAFKAAWILFTGAQYFAVYHAGYHWPFDSRATPYYGLLNDVVRFAGWMGLPLYGLWIWVRDYLRYRKVRSGELDLLSTTS